jgi:hypothetical protein
MRSEAYPKTMTHAGSLPSVTARSPVEEEEFVSRGYAPFKMPEFSEFPLTMTHPDHEPAREVSPESNDTPAGAMVRDIGDAMGTARLVGYVPSVWTGERFPAVVANNTAEEHRFAEQGYRRGGTTDRAAFDKAAAASLHPQESREFHEFPKYLKAPDGKDVLARSAAEERVIRAGWPNPQTQRTANQGARA